MMSIVCIRNIRTRSRGWMCIHIEQSRIHIIRSHMHHTVLEYTHRGGADSPAAAAASPLPPSPSRCRNAWFCFMVSSRCFSNADNSGATSSSSSTGMLLSGTRKRTTSAFATQMASQRWRSPESSSPSLSEIAVRCKMVRGAGVGRGGQTRGGQGGSDDARLTTEG